MGSADRAVVLVLYRRARAVFRRADPRDRSADHSLRAVLSEPRGPDRKILRLSAAVPGRDGRHRAKRQSAAADRLLGTDEPQLVSADRVLAPSAAGPPGGAHGAGGDRRRRAGADRRHADPRPDRRLVSAERTPRPRRHRQGVAAVPAGAAADPDRRVHEIGAVSVSFLAAARNVGADPGVGLSALGDDGQGRRLSARAAVAGSGRHRRPGS